MGAHAPIAAMSDATHRVLRWRLAVPPEKGGWVWWIGPLLIGGASGGSPGGAFVLVAAGALLAFCFKQPVTLLTKQLRKTHGQRYLGPPLFWTLLYATALLWIATLLLRMGHGNILALGVMAVPVFAWHVVLVYQRRDRHQQVLDISAAFALALAGPAAYWAAGGGDLAKAMWIWALPAAQSTASIVHMFVRLHQRALHAVPSLDTRLEQGFLPMLVHTAGLGLAVFAWQTGLANGAVVLAMLIPAAEGAWSVYRPQVEHAPKRLGMRQLFVSSAAMLLLALGFL